MIRGKDVEISNEVSRVWKRLKNDVFEVMSRTSGFNRVWRKGL